MTLFQTIKPNLLGDTLDEIISKIVLRHKERTETSIGFSTVRNRLSTPVEEMADQSLNFLETIKDVSGVDILEVLKKNQDEPVIH